MPFRLRLLGPPRLEVNDGRLRDLPVDRPASLAYYLVGREGWVRRDELAYLYNPDADETLALSNLRKLIHRLKQHNWAASLEADQTRLRFSLASDVQEYRQLIGQKQFARALEVYSGTFLQGISFPDLTGYEAWLELERQDLAQSWRNAVLEYARTLESNRELMEAERWLTRLSRADPLDEEAVQALLRVLRATGERSRANDVFEHFRTELKRELDSEPLEATRALVELRANDATQAAPNHNLPAPTTRFVGRKHELEHVPKLIAHNRLVTLLGLGGIGKTRLSLEVAWAQLETFRDGVWFVPLAGVALSDQVLPTIAQVLGVSLAGPGDPKLQLQQFLRGKHLLLVLDNFEHVIEAALLIEDLLEAAPELHLFVTSRIALELRAETLFDVDGLSFPSEQTREALESFDAVKLFLERMARLSSHFTITQGTLEAVADISRKVQGMPLALELAASWTRSLSPREVAQALERDMSLLSSRGRDMPHRHRSIQAVFDYSWVCLSTLERNVMKGLSVFVDGFTLEAAEWVAGAHLPLLLGLMNHSLVRRRPDGRFDLHELVRQYAMARSEEDLRAKDEARHRFAAYFAQFLFDRRKEGDLEDSKSGMDLNNDFQNIRVAWKLFLEDSKFDGLVAGIQTIWEYFFQYSSFIDGYKIFDETLKSLNGRTGDATKPDFVYILGKAHQCLGVFAFHVNGKTQADQHFHRSIALFKTIDHNNEIALSVRYLGLAWLGGDSGNGDLDQAIQHLERARNHYLGSGPSLDHALSLSDLGLAYFFQGHIDLARGCSLQSIEMNQALGHPNEVAFAKGTLAAVLFQEKNYQAAILTMSECAQTFEEFGNKRSLASALLELGKMHQAIGDHEKSIQLCQESIALKSKIGDFPSLPFSWFVLATSYKHTTQMEASLDAFVQSVSLSVQVDDPVQLTSAVIELIEVLAYFGEPDLIQKIGTYSLAKLQNTALKTRISASMLESMTTEPDRSLQPTLSQSTRDAIHMLMTRF